MDCKVLDGLQEPWDTTSAFTSSYPLSMALEVRLEPRR